MLYEVFAYFLLANQYIFAHKEAYHFFLLVKNALRGICMLFIGKPHVGCLFLHTSKSLFFLGLKINLQGICMFLIGSSLFLIHTGINLSFL
jgi:hypothetical protein